MDKKKQLWMVGNKGAIGFMNSVEMVSPPHLSSITERVMVLCYLQVPSGLCHACFHCLHRLDQSSPANSLPPTPVVPVSFYTGSDPAHAQGQGTDCRFFRRMGRMGVVPRTMPLIRLC
jgi:hypothetical protein